MNREKAKKVAMASSGANKKFKEIMREIEKAAGDGDFEVVHEYETDDYLLITCRVRPLLKEKGYTTINHVDGLKICWD